MLLKDLIDDLVNNELANLSIGKPQWDDAKFSYTKLIQCISLAYLELHKRFSLKKEYVLLNTLETRTKYPLIAAHASSNTVSTEDKFIIDSTESPFPDNIVKIDAVLDDKMQPVTYNTTTFEDQVRILDYRTLGIPDPTKVPVLNLVCRGLPAPIQLEQQEDIETYEIDLPETYRVALLCYAAGRVYINRGAENATNNESAIFYSRFEQACAEIQALSLNDTENMVNDRLSMKGFV